MLKKLRIKFIAIIMALVTIVLVVVFAGICISEYQRSVSTVNEALLSSVNRASEISFQTGPGQFGAEPAPNASDSAPLANSLDGEMPDGRPARNDMEQRDQRGQSGQSGRNSLAGPRIGGRGQQENNLVPVAVYTVDEAGNATMVPEFTSASIDSDVLESAVALIADKAEGTGTLGDVGLHYYKRTVDTVTYVSFADTATTDGWKSLALRLAIAMIATLAVFFVISLFLSKWALKPVGEAWDSQRQFVADASHELKTPLTVILANTSILLKHADNTIASESQWVESTQVEAERMQGLVTEMLELAQVEERAVAQHEKLDFSDMVDGESLQFESVAFENGCTYNAVIEEGISVSGEAERLRKMVSTLIENALKYVGDNGLVEICLRKQADQAVLSIRNTGSFIADDDLPHIFDRFYRTDKARTSGTGGFGLGLAIARETARAHGGDIVCASTEADGTTFTVTLPIA